MPVPDAGLLIDPGETGEIVVTIVDDPLLMMVYTAGETGAGGIGLPGMLNRGALGVTVVNVSPPGDAVMGTGE